MLKRILSIFVGVFITLSCAGVVKNELPTEPNVGYCWWDGAPEWAAKDFILSGWGVIDGFTVRNEHGVFHAFVIDAPQDGLDGECDHIAIVQETDRTHERYGYTAPTVVVRGSAPCESWQELKKSVGGQLDAFLLQDSKVEIAEVSGFYLRPTM